VWGAPIRFTVAVAFVALDLDKSFKSRDILVRYARPMHPPSSDFEHDTTGLL
jgi:hypothetical protein